MVFVDVLQSNHFFPTHLVKIVHSPCVLRRKNGWKTETVAAFLTSRTPGTHPPGRSRSLGLTDQLRQPGEEKDPSLKRHGGPVRPGLVTKSAGPDAISTGPPRCFAPDAHRALSSEGERKLEARFKKVITVKGALKFHCIIPIAKNKVRSKPFSFQEENNSIGVTVIKLNVYFVIHRQKPHFICCIMI